MVKSLHCPVCNCSNVSQAVQVDDLPPGAQYFSPFPNKYKNLSALLYQCSYCTHIFLDTEPVTYYRDVIRSTGISKAMTSFRLSQFAKLKSDFFSQFKIVNTLEVGCGSGHYAKILADSMGACVATNDVINSSNISHANLSYIQTHPDDSSFEEQFSHLPKFDLITCFSYLEHLPNPYSLIQKMVGLLSSSGKILIEVPNTDLILKNRLVNEIIPDHLHYFTSFSIHNLASRCNLNLISLKTIWDDYVLSILLEPKPSSPLEALTDQRLHFSYAVNQLLSNYSQDSLICMWGAGHQALFAISSSSLRNRLSFVVDSSPAKQGCFTPGTNIPIHSPQYLSEHPPDLLIIACAGYNNEVLRLAQSLTPSSDLCCLNHNDFVFA